MAIEFHNLKFPVYQYVEFDKHNLQVNTVLLLAI